MGIGNKEYVSGLDCNGQNLTSCGKITYIGIDTSGTPGNATANYTAGISAIAATATTCVITSSFVTPLSRVTINWLGDHGSTRSWVTRTSGSFTVNLASAATANTSFCWTITEVASGVLNGLIHYWPLDGNSNDVFVTGNGTDTAMSYVAGKISNCGSFNGTTSNIQTTINGPIGVNARSISLWAKFTDVVANNKTLLGYGTAATGQEFQIRQSTATIQLYQGSAGYSSCTITSGTTWYHYVLTWDGTTSLGYLNGGTSIVSGTPAINTASGVLFNMGAARATMLAFNGFIDEVAMWDRCLTASEVSTIYNAGSGKAWPFYP